MGFLKNENKSLKKILKTRYRENINQTENGSLNSYSTKKWQFENINIEYW